MGSDQRVREDRVFFAYDRKSLINILKMIYYCPHPPRGFPFQVDNFLCFRSKQSVMLIRDVSNFFLFVACLFLCVLSSLTY